jgi:hypothetical protein
MYYFKAIRQAPRVMTGKVRVVAFTGTLKVDRNYGLMGLSVSQRVDRAFVFAGVTPELEKKHAEYSSPGRGVGGGDSVRVCASARSRG